MQKEQSQTSSFFMTEGKMGQGGYFENAQSIFVFYKNICLFQIQ
jgi:hypothetical protein